MIAKGEMLDSPAVTGPDDFRDRLPQFLAELREMVEIETPTRHLPGLERLANWLERRLAPVARVERRDLDRHGPLVRALRPGTGCRVLLLAHYDTVWPVGSWPELWTRHDDRVLGPGVYDMKGGVLLAVWALEALADRGVAAPSVEFLVTPDEEIGSPGSRAAVVAAAHRADFVLVLEPTIAGGPLKIARKGSGEFILTITGRAAHQGVEPEKGRNAVLEAAHQVLALRALEDLAAGTTVGPNVLHGGSASNVVAERAELRVDVRVWRRSEQERISAAMARLAPVVDGTSLALGGGWNRPPMEPTPLSLALYERARAIGTELGQEIGSLRWGGASDANLTAAAGAPTVDGFGPVGAGAHQRDEHLVVSALPARLELLTRLLASFARPAESWLTGEARSLYEVRRRARAGAPEAAAART